jgi:hypothetical protein
VRLRPPLVGHRIVEEPIQMWQRRVDAHPCDRRRSHCYDCAAAARWSARSVRSHVKSGSSRPKCPYVAVWR